MNNDNNNDVPERICPWPSGADLKEQLYGPTEEIWNAAKFIKNIHIQIWVETTAHLNAEEEVLHDLWKILV